MTNQSTPTSHPDAIGYDTYGYVLNNLDRERIPWQPVPGSKIAGLVTAIVTARSEYGAYPLVTIDPGENLPLYDVHCFHAYLKSDIIRAELRPGDTIGIKFIDKNGQRGAARYRVEVNHTGTGQAYTPGPEVMNATDAVGNQYEEPF